MRVDDGWILAYNIGEFGAAVYWYSADGKQKTKISDHHINGFTVDGDRIFAASGLAHLSVTEGAILELIKNKETKKWSVSEYIKLKEAADGIAVISTKNFVIATTYQLIQVTPQKKSNTF